MDITRAILLLCLGCLLCAAEELTGFTYSTGNSTIKTSTPTDLAFTFSYSRAFAGSGGSICYKLPPGWVVTNPSCFLTSDATATPLNQVTTSSTCSVRVAFTSATSASFGGDTVPVALTCKGFTTPRFLPITADGIVLPFAFPGSAAVTLASDPPVTGDAVEWPEIEPQASETASIDLGSGAQWAHMAGASPQITVTAQPLFHPSITSQSAFDGENAFIELSVPASAVNSDKRCTATSTSLTTTNPTLTFARGLATARLQVASLVINLSAPPSITFTCPAGAITLPSAAQAASIAVLSLRRPPSASGDDETATGLDGETTTVKAADSDAAAWTSIEFPAVTPRAAADVEVAFTSDVRVGRFGPVTVSFVTPVALKATDASGETLRIGLPTAFALSKGLQKPVRCEQGTGLPLQLVSTDSAAGTATFYLHTAVKAWDKVSIRCTGVSYPLAPFSANPTGATVEFFGIGNAVVVPIGRGNVPAVGALPADSLGSTTARMTLTESKADAASEFTVTLMPLSGTAAVPLSSVAPLRARLPLDSRPPSGATCDGAVKQEGKPDELVSFTATHAEGDEFVTFAPAGATEVPKGAGVSFSCAFRLPLNPRPALRDVVWSYGEVVPVAVLFPEVFDVTNKLFFTPAYPGAESAVTAVLSELTSPINADQVIAISLPLPSAGRGVFLTGSALRCEQQTAAGLVEASPRDTAWDQYEDSTNILARLRLIFDATVGVDRRLVCHGLSFGSGLVLGGPQRLPVRVYSSWPPIDDGQGSAEGQGKLMLETWTRFDPAPARPTTPAPNSIVFASRSAGKATEVTVRLLAFTFPLTPIHEFDLSLTSALVSANGDGGLTCEMAVTNAAGQVVPAPNVRTTVRSATDPTGLTRTWTIGIASGNVVTSSNKVDYVITCKSLRNPDAQQPLPMGRLALYTILTETVPSPGEGEPETVRVTARGLVSEIALTPASVLPSELNIEVAPTSTVPNSISDLVFSILSVPVPLIKDDVITLTLPPSHLFTLDTGGTTGCALLTPDTREGAAPGATRRLVLSKQEALLSPVTVGDATLLRLVLTASAAMSQAIPRGADIVVSCSNVLNPAATPDGSVTARWLTSTGTARASEDAGRAVAIEYPIPGTERAELLPESTIVGAKGVTLTLVLSPIPVDSGNGTRVFIALPAPATGWVGPATTGPGDKTACMGSLDSMDPNVADITGATTVNAATNEVEFVLDEDLPATTGTFRLFCKGVTLPTTPAPAKMVTVRFVAPSPSTLITMLSPSVALPAITAASTPVPRGVVLVPLSFPTSTTLISYQIDGIVNAFALNKDLVKLRVEPTPHRQYIESGAAVLVVALRSLSPWIHADDLLGLIAPFIPDVAATINTANIGLRAVPLNSPLAVSTLPARCFNGVKDADEADVDCGGDSSCGRCAFNRKCGRATDCLVSECKEPATGGGTVCPWVGAKFPNAAPPAAAASALVTLGVAAAVAVAVAVFAG